MEGARARRREEGAWSTPAAGVGPGRRPVARIEWGGGQWEAAVGRWEGGRGGGGRRGVAMATA